MAFYILCFLKVPNVWSSSQMYILWQCDCTKWHFICVHIHVHVCLSYQSYQHIYMYTHISVKMHMYIYLCVSCWVFVYVYNSTYVLNTCSYVYICIQKHLRVQVHLCIHTFGKVSGRHCRTKSWCYNFFLRISKSLWIKFPLWRQQADLPAWL